jgi:hypothetical protein
MKEGKGRKINALTICVIFGWPDFTVSGLPLYRARTRKRSTIRMVMDFSDKRYRTGNITEAQQNR